jgi:arsenite methyltransferase
VQRDAATGRGSGWDSARAAARVVRAYEAPDLAAVRAVQVELLAPRPAERILDVGCGPGLFAEAIAVHGATVTGVDSSPAMVAAAAVRGVTAVEGDAEDLPFAEETFDAACLVQVLEYVDDPVSVISEAARVVRPGGRLLVADTDWDTLALAINDLALARRYAHAFADTKRHGQAGRHLRRWLAEAGLDPVASRAVVLESQPEGDAFLAHNWSYFRATVERSGHLDAASLDRLHGELVAAARRGAVPFSVNRHAWLARIPEVPS